MKEAENLQVLFENAIIAKTSPKETYQIVLKSRDKIDQQRKFAIECQNRCKLLEALYIKREEILIQEKFEAEEAARQLEMQCEQIRIEIVRKESRRNTMIEEQRDLERRMNNHRHERERARRERGKISWLTHVPIANVIFLKPIDDKIDRLTREINSLSHNMNNLECDIWNNQLSLSDLENQINVKRNQSNYTSQEITSTQERMWEVRQIISFCIQACQVWKELDVDGKSLELRASTISNLLQKYNNSSESQSLKFLRSRAFTNSAQSFYSDWIDFTNAIREKSNNSLCFRCERCNWDYNGLPFTKNDMIVCEGCYNC